MPVNDKDKGNPSEHRSLSITELAHLFKVSVKTMKTWLKPLGEKLGPKVGRYYNQRQLNIIWDDLGRPFIWLGMIFARVFMGDSSGENDRHENDQPHHPAQDASSVATPALVVAGAVVAKNQKLTWRRVLLMIITFVLGTIFLENWDNMKHAIVSMF